MASKSVPAQYLTAGQDYLDALVSLGLTPAYLGWGWDPKASQWLLVLVTSIVDAGGPLPLNRLLFRAYNAKATPKEISPFIVRIFSPEVVAYAGGSDFWMLGQKGGLSVTRVKDASGKPIKNDKPIRVENVQKTFMGLELEMINSYQTLSQAAVRSNYHQRHHEWQRFKRNVERLAA